jgi:hypothetical protein
MKIHKQIVLALVLISCTFQLAAEDSFGKIITTLNETIESREKASENSTSASTTIWSTPENPQLFPQLTITREFSISDGIYEIKCYDRQKADGTWDCILVNFSNKDHVTLNKSDTISPLYQLIDAFGQPKVIIDENFTKRNKESWCSRARAQWDFNAYQLFFWQLDLNDNNGIPISSIGYINLVPSGNMDDLKNLYLISLNPSSVYNETNKQWLPKDDAIRLRISFIVDLNEKKLLNSNFDPIGNVASLSATLMTFQIDRDTFSFHYSIDRFTGDFTGEYQCTDGANFKLYGVAEKNVLPVTPQF